MKSAIFILFDKSHHIGAATLINSLVAKKFKGDIWIGYRGKLPQWALELVRKNNAQENISLNENIKINFIEENYQFNFSNYKPSFILKIINKYPDRYEKVFFFDTDIVLNVEWEVIDSIISEGVLLNEDFISPFSANHPLFSMWQEFIKSNLHQNLQMNHREYVNGGFLGLHINSISFLTDWERIISLIEKRYPDSLENIQLARNGNWRHIFGHMDQDALNIVSQMTTHKVILLPMHSMGFSISGGLGTNPLYYHFVLNPKPWMISNLSYYYLKGNNSIMPFEAHKLFWSFSSGPIAPFSKLKLFFKKIDLRIANFLKRFLK